MEEVVGSCPRGGRNFSHGKLFKIMYLCKLNALNVREEN